MTHTPLTREELEQLSAIHSALDGALGDSDILHIEDDEELREQEPVQWAAMKLAQFIAAQAPTDTLRSEPALRQEPPTLTSVPVVHRGPWR